MQRIAAQLPRQLERAMRVRGEVLAASLSETRKLCGKPNCKCARGDKHVVYQLSWTEEGRRRSTHIRPDELERVRAAMEQYRQLRQCRAELLKLAAEGAALMDALVEALQVAPPDKRGDGRR
jgi:hypothetical protein